MTEHEVWELGVANRAKPQSLIEVSFEMSVPTDASDEAIAEYLRYQLFGGSLPGAHSLTGIRIRTDDPSTIGFRRK